MLMFLIKGTDHCIKQRYFTEKSYSLSYLLQHYVSFRFSFTENSPYMQLLTIVAFTVFYII